MWGVMMANSQIVDLLGLITTAFGPFGLLCPWVASIELRKLNRLAHTGIK